MATNNLLLTAHPHGCLFTQSRVNRDGPGFPWTLALPGMLPLSPDVVSDITSDWTGFRVKQNPITKNEPRHLGEQNVGKSLEEKKRSVDLELSQGIKYSSYLPTGHWLLGCVVLEVWVFIVYKCVRKRAEPFKKRALPRISPSDSTR